MPDDNAKELHKRGSSLFEKKKPIDSLNQEVAYNFYPERADFTTEMQWGEEFATHLFDSSPVLARRDLCNMFASMLRPRGQPWFKATVGEEELMDEQPVQALCDGVTKIMRRQIYRHGSQFGDATKQTDHDYGTFGNGVLWIGVNRNRNGLLFRNYHLRDCVWVEGPDGDIDKGGGLWRKFKMSARNIKAEYPKADLHQSIKDALDKDPDREFELCHVLLPADEYYSGKRPRGLGKMEWASVYYDHEHCSILKEDGSPEFRYVVPRWQRISGSPYAISPAALTGLPDGRGLQKMARILIEAGEKSVDPPMLATAGAVVGGINLFSGGVTWKEKNYDEKLGAALEPIELGKQVALGVEMLVRAQMSLKDCWYLTKLNIPPQSGRTAYEASEIVKEFVRANIPLFEPVETSYSAPMLDLIAQTLMRLGAFRHLSWPREVLEYGQGGGEFEWGFSNPLQDAIEQNKSNQLSILLGAVAGAKEIDPNVLHVNDWPYIIRDVTSGIGAPAKWSIDPEVEQAKQRAQQQAGNVIAGLNAAGQVADVMKTGTEAAANLQGIAGAAAPADGTAAYGPV